MSSFMKTDKAYLVLFWVAFGLAVLSTALFVFSLISLSIISTWQ